jgi:nitrous oxide reductase accessory protein NosL
VKKTLVVMLAIVAVAAAGCKKKEEAPKATAPEAAAPAGQAPAAAPAGDPHAGLKPQEVKPGSGHKGKVLETMDSGGYTYVLADENGQKIWVAAMQTPVKVGDTVEFPDSPPMVNFQSKTLKRTFDKIIFAPGLAVNK